MTAALPEKYQVWDSYWHDNRLHSVVSDMGPEAESAIDTLWQPVAAELPNGAKVLDLACGNGAVSLVVAETAQQTGKTFDLHCTASAPMGPNWGGELRRVLVSSQ